MIVAVPAARVVLEALISPKIRVQRFDSSSPGICRAWGFRWGMVVGRFDEGVISGIGSDQTLT